MWYDVEATRGAEATKSVGATRYVSERFACTQRKTPEAVDKFGTTTQINILSWMWNSIPQGEDVGPDV